MNFKFILYSFLSFYIFANKKTINKLSKKEEIYVSDNDDEDYVRKKTKEENKDQTEIIDDNIEDETLKEENTPQLKVLLPIRRFGSSKTKLNEGPCGGIEMKKADTLLKEGGKFHYVWETVVPISNGNCSVKISPRIQENLNFTTLHPLDTKYTYDGKFECGRNKGFESKEFQLPKNFECDGCTLQFKWETEYGDIYSCSDIMINGDVIGQCLGKCLNGGNCFNGKCLCPEGFSGEFCESSGGSSNILKYLGILALIVGLCVVGIYLNKRFDIINSIKRFFISQEWLKPKEKDQKNYFDENDNQNQMSI